MPGGHGEDEDGCVKEGRHASTSGSSAIGRAIMLMCTWSSGFLKLHLLKNTLYGIPHRKEMKAKLPGGRLGVTAAVPMVAPGILSGKEYKSGRRSCRPALGTRESSES